MTRVSVFNSPHMLGFDHFERVLDRIAKTSGEGYPPYNIEQTSETVSVEDNQLIIRGRNAEEDPNRIYLHRGIAARQFQRAFVLAEGIEVKNATMDNGLLHIDLQRPLPETRVRTVKIEQSAGNTIDGNALGVSKGK
jgi:HSP20 family molecular chaperone IbpA